MTHVLTLLGGEALQGQSYGEREMLLPLLHLFRELLTMVSMRQSCREAVLPNELVWESRFLPPPPSLLSPLLPFPPCELLQNLKTLGISFLIWKLVTPLLECLHSGTNFLSFHMLRLVS